MIAGSLFNTHADVDISIERHLTSGVARGERGGGLPRESPFWGDTIFQCESITPLLCDEDFVLQLIGSPSTLGPKTHSFFGEDLFLVFTENHSVFVFFCLHLLLDIILIKCLIT